MAIDMRVVIIAACCPARHRRFATLVLLPRDDVCAIKKEQARVGALLTAAVNSSRGIYACDQCGSGDFSLLTARLTDFPTYREYLSSAGKRDWDALNRFEFYTLALAYPADSTSEETARLRDVAQRRKNWDSAP